jgi:hypothetical protein
VHVLEADGETLRALTYVWDGRGFALAADRRFPRGARDPQTA